MCSNWSRDSAVGIATRYGLDGPEVEFRWRARFSAPVQTDPGAHPASYTMCTGSFLGVKRPGRGVALTTHPHLAPKLKKELSYTSALPVGSKLNSSVSYAMSGENCIIRRDCRLCDKSLVYCCCKNLKIHFGSL